MVVFVGKRYWVREIGIFFQYSEFNYYEFNEKQSGLG